MMRKCICSVNIGLTSGFSLDTTVAWSRALILIIIPGGWCVWELILINSTFEMSLAERWRPRGSKSSICIDCGKGHSYLRFGGGNYGYDGVVVKNVGINSVFFMTNWDVDGEVCSWKKRVSKLLIRQKWRNSSSRAASLPARIVLNSSCAILSIRKVKRRMKGL